MPLTIARKGPSLGLARGRWCCAGWKMRWQTATAFWRSFKGLRSTMTARLKRAIWPPVSKGRPPRLLEAHQVAGVTADSISYVECHGTGTYLGDPIEVAALTEAFRKTTDATGFCRIGSVKTNIGHTDTAAGVASLIKVASALHHRELPPSLGYEAPNPAIDFDTSPFRVNDRLTPWQGGPLRAGVNSLGVGGTNAHVVVQEAPAIGPSDDSDWPFQPLVLSARSKSALNDMAQNLADHLRAHPEQPLADVAFTLKNGRTPFAQRRVVVAESHEQAATLLEADDPRRVFTHTALTDPDVVFMFPGGGAQYAGMARDLYATEPVLPNGWIGDWTICNRNSTTTCARSGCPRAIWRHADEAAEAPVGPVAADHDH
jgi:acyl transferase domain-containing protein